MSQRVLNRGRKQREGRPGRTPNVSQPEAPLPAFLWRWWMNSGMSLPKCADTLGVTRKTFQRWVYGETVPSRLARQQIVARLQENGVKVPKRLQ